MTNEKALMYLKNKSCVYCAISDDIDYVSAFECQHSDCLIHKASVVAVEALEKQIPKKPNEGEYKFFPVCPNCDMHLDADDTWVMTRNYEKGEERFCLYCGQALDWNEEI